LFIGIFKESVLLTEVVKNTVHCELKQMERPIITCHSRLFW